MVTADSLYVSGGLSKTQLRNKNDKSSCFRPLCTGSVWDTRVIGRTVQCVSCKHHSVSPTSSVVVTCQIQLQRSSWDWFQELPCTTGNNEWSVRLFIILVHVSISVSVLKNSRLLEQILILFFLSSIVRTWQTSFLQFTWYFQHNFLYCLVVPFTGLLGKKFRFRNPSAQFALAVQIDPLRCCEDLKCVVTETVLVSLVSASFAYHSWRQDDVVV